MNNKIPYIKLNGYTIFICYIYLILMKKLLK